MKTKKLLAAAAALCLCGGILPAASASAEIYGDHNGDGNVDAMDAALILQYAAYAGAGGTQTFYEFVHGSEGGDISSDDGTLTILNCNDDTLSGMIAQYQAAYPNANVEWVQVGEFGSEAAELYATYLLSGKEADLYIVQPDWALRYLNDDSLSIPLSAIGITESDYPDAYDYSIELGKNSNGELRGATALLSPGGYCYRTDLAEEYLGIDSAEYMQECISDWDGFLDTASRLSTASGGSITMAASYGDLLNPFFSTPDSPWVENNVLDITPAARFIDLYMGMTQNGSLDPSVMQWTAEWTEAGIYDGTLGYFYASWCLPDNLMLEQNGGDAGNWAIVPGPEAFYWGGEMFCVAPQCNSAEEAERFLRYFTVEADSMEAYMNNYGESLGYLVNNRAAMSAFNETHHGSPLLGGQDYFAVLSDAADSIDLKAENLTMYDSAAVTNLHTAIYKNADADPDTILADFIVKMQESNPDLTVN